MVALRKRIEYMNAVLVSALPKDKSYSPMLTEQLRIFNEYVFILKLISKDLHQRTDITNALTGTFKAPLPR